MTFELPIMGMPLNLTMSRYPQLSNAEDLISINLDGRFFDKQTQTTEVPLPASFAQRQEQSEELFIH